MNGLLGWALSEIGFDVTRVCAGVMRSERGDTAFGNHLMLSIDLGEPWIADVGLGDGILEPVPLRPGPCEQGSRLLRFEVLADNEWRLHNYPGALPANFDFMHTPADEALIAQTCKTLQVDPKSMFRQNLVCQQMVEAGAYSLLGRVLTAPSGERQLLNSATELAAVLEQKFRINLREILPEITDLWALVIERHRTLFGETPVAEISFGPG
jgi:N-hydroxyarylamine O-acetyltransferase